MKLHKLINCNKIFKLKYFGDEAPNVCMETNLNCNIKCRNCYNYDRNYVKTFDEVKQDIDTALRIRKIETITLVGGEPTLHPNIVEIVEYVKSKNKICQLSSNCTFIINDNSDDLLKKLVKAGLNRILIHVDIGQSHIYNNIYEVLDIITQKLEKYKLWYLISQTIYEENIETISTLIKRYAKNRYYTGVFATIEASFNNIAKDCYDEDQIEKVVSNLYKELNVLPISYIPSSLDDEEISWLMYLFYMNSSNNNTHDYSSLYYRAVLKVYRVIKGVNVFAITYSPRAFHALLPIGLLFELIFNTKNAGRLFKVVKGSRLLRNINMKYIVIQNGPRYNEEKGKYQICYNCPDATIRNGKLSPLCISDVINQINSNEVENIELRNDVFDHFSLQYNEEEILSKVNVDKDVK